MLFPIKEYTFKMNTITLFTGQTRGGGGGGRGGGYKQIVIY